MNFKSLTQVFDYFKDDATCIAFMEQMRWGGDPACPHCGIVGAYRTNRGYKCKDKECNKKFSITSGTPIDNTKVPLRKWFACMYLLASHKKGISSIQMGKYIDVKQTTAWFMMHRVREMLKETNPEKLTGLVEVDEVYIGGKEKNKHKNKKNAKGTTGMIGKTPAIGMLQRGGNVRVQVIGEANRASLMPLVLANVCTSATLITDGFGGYTTVGKSYAAHEVIGHDKDEYVRGKFHTNTIEGFFSHFSRSIIGTWHFISRKHTQRYANEVAFRYNTRNLGDMERFSLVIGSFRQEKLTYKHLTA